MQSVYYYSKCGAGVQNESEYTKVFIDKDDSTLGFIMGMLGTNGAGESDRLICSTLYDLGDNLLGIVRNVGELIDKGIEVVIYDVGIVYTKGSKEYSMLQYYSGVDKGCIRDTSKDVGIISVVDKSEHIIKGDKCDRIIKGEKVDTNWYNIVISSYIKDGLGLQELCVIHNIDLKGLVGYIEDNIKCTNKHLYKRIESKSDYSRVLGKLGLCGKDVGYANEGIKDVGNLDVVNIKDIYIYKTIVCNYVLKRGSLQDLADKYKVTSTSVIDYIENDVRSLSVDMYNKIKGLKDYPTALR